MHAGHEYHIRLALKHQLFKLEANFQNFQKMKNGDFSQPTAQNQTWHSLSDAELHAEQENHGRLAEKCKETQRGRQKAQK